MQRVKKQKICQEETIRSVICKKNKIKIGYSEKMHFGGLKMRQLHRKKKKRKEANGTLREKIKEIKLNYPKGDFSDLT